MEGGWGTDKNSYRRAMEMRLCIPKSLCLSLQCNPLPKSQFLVFFLIFHTDPEKPCLVPALDGTKQGLCWEPSTGNPAQGTQETVRIKGMVVAREKDAHHLFLGATDCFWELLPAFPSHRAACLAVTQPEPAPQGPASSAEKPTEDKIKGQGQSLLRTG